jgi:hypothetical protein
VRLSNDFPRGGTPLRRTCACQRPRRRRTVAIADPDQIVDLIEGHR